MSPEQEWGANGEHEALAAPSTMAAQYALAESRQRRDDRSLDKGAYSLLLPEFGTDVWIMPSGTPVDSGLFTAAPLCRSRLSALAHLSYF